MIFTNRQEAGELLAQKLMAYQSPETIVLGLARGGVVIGKVIAETLEVSFDVLTVKKLATDNDPELAIGALAPDNTKYIDWKLAHRLGIDEKAIQTLIIPRVQKLINERTLRYHRGRKHTVIRDKNVILVDDGAATGATMLTAVLYAKKKKARKIIVAVPVAPEEFIKDIKPEVDDLVVLDTPHDFRAVGQFYENFPQVSDDEVIQLLKG